MNAGKITRRRSVANFTSQIFNSMNWNQIEDHFVGTNCQLRPRTVVSGTYLIDNVYVGTSQRIRERIMRHILLAAQGKHSNKELENYILAKIKNGQKLSITLVSDSKGDEAKVFYDLQSKGYPLLNSPQGRLLNQACFTPPSCTKLEKS